MFVYMFAKYVYMNKKFWLNEYAALLVTEYFYINTVRFIGLFEQSLWKLYLKYNYVCARD